MISGAQYTMVPIGSEVLSFISIEQPKSPSFIVCFPSTSFKKTLFGLISLCITPFPCIIFKASAKLLTISLNKAFSLFNSPLLNR